MPIRTYSPIYAVLTNPVVGEHLVYDGTKWVNSVGGGVTETLAQTLASGNVTGGNNISITSGDSIVYNNGAFTASIVEPTLAGNIVLTLPSSTGTLALLSDVQASDTLAEILAIGNTTGGTDISMTSGDTIAYNVGSGGNLNSLSTTGARTWNLPDNSGTIALLSDLAAQNELSEVLANGNTTGANDISINTGQSIIYNNSSFTATISEPTLSGNIVLTLPASTGTIALTSDIPAPTGDGIYTGSGSLSVATSVTMATNNLRFNSTGLSDLLRIDATLDKVIIGASTTTSDLFGIRSKGNSTKALVVQNSPFTANILTVGQNSTGDGYLLIANNSNAANVQLVSNGDSYIRGTGNKFIVGATTTTANIFGVKSSGNNTSPMVIANSSGSAAILWFREDASGNGILRVQDVSPATTVELNSSGDSYFNAGSIGIGITSPNTSAILDITSTTKGVLFPRMTAVQGSAITGVNGLVIYVTSTNATFTSVGFWGYEAGAWVKL